MRESLALGCGEREVMAVAFQSVFLFLVKFPVSVRCLQGTPCFTVPMRNAILFLKLVRNLILKHPCGKWTTV